MGFERLSYRSIAATMGANGVEMPQRVAIGRAAWLEPHFNVAIMEHRECTQANLCTFHDRILSSTSQTWYHVVGLYLDTTQHRLTEIL